VVTGSRGILIVGFERCMTTSLSAYLTRAGFADHLVEGLKEPGIFSADVDRADQIVAKRSNQLPGTWLLDASVDYALNANALRTIVDTFEDYRIFVCLRDQLERTISAYSLYKRSLAVPVTETTISAAAAGLRFGTTEQRISARMDQVAPSFLLPPIAGRYVFTAMLAKLRRLHPDDPEVSRIDEEVERFAGTAFAARAMDELRRLKRDRQLPLLSILVFSYFNRWMRQIVSIADPRRIIVATMGNEAVQSILHERLSTILDVRGVESCFPRENGLPRNAVRMTDIEMVRDCLDASFREDTGEVLNLLRRYPEIDTTMFRQQALYGELRE